MNLLNMLKKVVVVSFLLPIAAFAAAPNSSLIARGEGGAHHEGEHHAAGVHHGEAFRAGEHNGFHRGLNNVNGVNVNGGGGVVTPEVIEATPTYVVPSTSSGN